MQNKTKMIAIDALFIALIIIFTFTTYLGYIPVGPVTFTTMHILVILGAMLFGYKRGLLYGFAFGLSSLIRAAVMPTGAMDTIFVNPFISILPRMLFGFLAGYLFELIRGFENKKIIHVFNIILPIVLTVLHTVLTITCLYLFGVLDPFGITNLLGISDFFSSYISLTAFFTYLGIVTVFGMIGEAVLAGILCPSSYLILTKYVFKDMEPPTRHKKVL